VRIAFTGHHEVQLGLRNGFVPEVALAFNESSKRNSALEVIVVVGLSTLPM
jgi:hypothetical protein